VWQLDVELAGRRVRLEPLGRTHEAGLYRAARFDAIWQWWPFNPAESRETFSAWVDDCVRAANDGARQHFATLASESGEPIGSTSFCTPRHEHRGIEIGWTWLTPRAWGTGANTEAKLLMLRHAFEVLGCQRVEFETDADNLRSRRALEALPAQFEGIHRDDKLVRGGVRRSSAYYSILDREWPLVEARLSERLGASRQ
jgi:RimJ/RimL family protein N-acetyltransferase